MKKTTSHQVILSNDEIKNAICFWLEHHGVIPDASSADISFNFGEEGGDLLDRYPGWTTLEAAVVTITENKK